MTEKLGPSLGPTEKYFERFQTYFNSLSRDEREGIRLGASSCVEWLSPTDDITKEMFFSHFIAKSNGFQRDDYRELARLIMVGTK